MELAIQPLGRSPFKSFVSALFFYISMLLQVYRVLESLKPTYFTIYINNIEINSSSYNIRIFSTNPGIFFLSDKKVLRDETHEVICWMRPINLKLFLIMHKIDRLHPSIKYKKGISEAFPEEHGSEDRSRKALLKQWEGRLSKKDREGRWASTTKRGQRT